MQNIERSTIKTRRKDIRIFAIVVLVLLVLALGGGLQWFANPTTRPSIPLSQAMPPANLEHPEYKRIGLSAASKPEPQETVWQAPADPIDPRQDPSGHMQQARTQEAESRFQQALLMLHAEQYDEAIVALNRFLTLFPDSVDGYVNLGYALIGKSDYTDAFSAFDRAIDLNPAQSNAYYGAAIALEGMGNLEGALSGMRSFLHLTDKGPGQIHVAKARSAIWEWESQLGRGPWGPTKGIPPGFTREELKRNDQGAGIKIQIPGTEDENGMSQYEIKYQSKFKLFDD